MYLYNSKTGYEKAILSTFRKTVTVSNIEELNAFIREKAIVEFKIALNRGENKSPIFGVNKPALTALFNPEEIENVSDSYFKALLEYGELDSFIKESKTNKKHSILKHRIEMFNKIESAGFERQLDVIFQYLGEYRQDFFRYASCGYLNYQQSVIQKALKAEDLSIEEKASFRHDFIDLLDIETPMIISFCRNHNSIRVTENVMRAVLSRDILERIL